MHFGVRGGQGSGIADLYSSRERDMLNKMLLATSAVIVTVIGAQAADLPSKKAAPATYVKICDAYGAGFFYIPGSETCVKLGGYVRAEYQYVPGKDMNNPAATTAAGVISQSKNVQSETGFEVRGRIDLDARTPTSMGAARTFIRLRAANTSGIRNVKPSGNFGTQTESAASTTGITIESALVQWAGFTFGVASENYAMMPSQIYNANPWAGFPNGMKQIAYTATLGGGVSATLAIEDRRDFGYDPESTVYQRVSTGANIVGNVRMDQAWGFAAVHGLVGNNSVDNAKINGGVGEKTYSAYALGATVNFKLPMIAAGDQVWFTANYADGALGAIMSGGSLNNLATASARRISGGVLYIASNVQQTGGAGTPSAANVMTYDGTTGWNIAMAATHYWAPQWRSNFSTGYVEFNPPKAAASYTALTLGKGKVWEVAGSLIYSPAKDFDIGLELQYASMKAALQNASTTNAWALAGSPGLSASNVTTKLRIERAF